MKYLHKSLLCLLIPLVFPLALMRKWIVSWRSGHGGYPIYSLLINSFVVPIIVLIICCIIVKKYRLSLVSTFIFAIATCMLSVTISLLTYLIASHFSPDLTGYLFSFSQFIMAAAIVSGGFIIMAIVRWALSKVE